MVAKLLYKSLREMELKGVDFILFEGLSNSKEGLAVMNRITKASTKVI